MIEPLVLACPYCGESFETAVDVSGGSQRYVEDCQVCCRPIEVAITVDDDGTLTDVRTSTDRD